MGLFGIDNAIVQRSGVFMVDEWVAFCTCKVCYFYQQTRGGIHAKRQKSADNFWKTLECEILQIDWFSQTNSQSVHNIEKMQKWIVIKSFTTLLILLENIS
jgi:hypothetical protein